MLPSDLLKKIVRVFTEGWNKQIPEDMLALSAENFVPHRPPLQDIRGVEAEKQDISKTFEAFSEIQFVIHEIAMDKNIAMLRWTWQAKHTGSFSELPMEPTGKAVSMEGCSVLHFENGKIVEEWEYADYPGFFTQLGMIQTLE